MNSSFIVLVPEINNPSKVEGYWLIGLLESTYTIVAKLLIGRFKKVIMAILSDTQKAFVWGK